ncbi:putative Ig domain-containing protein [Chitinimonas naiadis]
MAPLAQAGCTITFSANKTGSTLYTFINGDMVLCDPTLQGAYNDANLGLGNVTMSPSGSTLQMDSFSDPSHIQFTYVGNGNGSSAQVETAHFWTIANDGFTIVQNDVRVFINPTIAISPSSLTNGAVGSSYNETLAATGGTAPYSYVVSSGSLPPGLLLSSGGVLSGTPTANGTFNFSIRVTDNTGSTVTQAYTLTVNAPTITYSPSSPASGTVGSAYSQSLASASGGTAPYTYAVVAGGLPSGVTLASNGALSGTPTAGGTFNFTVRTTDSSGGSGPFNRTSSNLSLTIASPSITLAPASLSDGTVASAYSAALSAIGGTSSYTYAITAGTLPSGLSLNTSSGALSGTPTMQGTYNFTVTATDSSTGTGPYTANRVYTLTVNAPTLAINPASGGSYNGTVGIAYSRSFSASGGTSPYTYVLNVNSGSLPTGLSFSTSTGVLSGTPSTAGSVSFTVTAMDSSAGSGPYSVSGSYNLSVGAPNIQVAPASLPSPAAGAAYSESVSASGGTAPYGYTVSAGGLPAGLTLNSTTGLISGTPTATGSFNFTVTATDAGNYTGSKAFSVVVSAPTIAVAPASLTSAMVGSPYNRTVSATGGTAAYSYAVTAGTLPAGLNLNATTGALSGTPTAAGSFNFTVTATDSTTGVGSPFTAGLAYTLTVLAPALTISPTSGSNLSGSALTAYSQTFAVGAGASPYTYGLVINSGSMPTGLTFSTSTGVLSGTPTSAGTVNFTVTGTDSATGTGAPFSISGTYSLTIGAPTVTVAPASLPNPAVGSVYSQTVSASGGSAPYTFAVSAGSLPLGLNLNVTTGVVSGTPTAAGTANFTVQATDANHFVGTRVYSFTVAAPTIAVAPASLSNGQQAVAYSQTVSATGGIAPYTFAVTAGSLPVGVSLNTVSGVLSGTPSTIGNYSFTVSATDSSTGTGAPFTVSRAYSVTVSMQPPVAAAKSASTNSNTPVAFDLTGSISGGVPASIAVATAPGHGTTSINGLVITYTPANGFSGTDSFTYTAINAGGTSAVATVTISVTSPLPAPVVNNVTMSVLADSSNNAAPLSMTGVVDAVSVTSPAGHGTAVVNGTGIVYTPASSFVGVDSFTYAASNLGGSSSPATVTVTIVPRIIRPVAGDVSMVIAANSKNNPVTLNLSGGSASSIAVTTAPAHGTIIVNGTAVSYTPAAEFSGVDSFTYTATNEAGSSAPATVSITVVPPPPVVRPVQSNVVINSANNTIQLIIDGGPVTSITIVTPPKHGKVTLVGQSAAMKTGAVAAAAISTPSLKYTPDTGYVGPDSFTYTASNAAGTSAPAMVSLQVTLPPPVLGKVSGVVQAGQSISLDVAAQATGGPFTGLAIVGAPGSGSAVVQGTSIVYTSKPGFSGQVSITYALSNAYGASQGVATVDVEDRPDPSRDAEVNGLLSAQADSARRFADAQVNNFARRMESLHRDGWSDSSFGLSVAPVGAGPASSGKHNTPDQPGTTQSERRAKLSAMRSKRGADVAGDAQLDDAGPAAPAARRALGIWVGGNIDFGQRNALTGQEAFRFHTDGVSLGADYRVNSALSLGVGAGFGRDVSDVGEKGSKSKATNNVMALYGTLRPAAKVFIDALVGYGQLDYDLNRYQTGGGSHATGSRKGRQTFGALVGGYEFRGADWLVSTYGRLDGMNTTLDGYTESAAIYPLRFDEQVIRSSSAAAGLRLLTRYDLGLGSIEPRARIEYRRNFQGADDAHIRYADFGNAGVLYTSTAAESQRSQWLVEIGGKWHLRSDVSISLDYSAGLNNSSGYSHAIRTAIEMLF